MLDEGQGTVEVQAVTPTSPPIQVGDVVGRLTVHSMVGRFHGADRWECACSCGRVVFRASHNLKAAKARGTQSMCRHCLRVHGGKLRSGPMRRARQHKLHLRFWEKWGTLYGDRWIEGEIHEIREASELPDPIDIPPAPFIIDGEPETSWQTPGLDSGDGMTLEEIGLEMGLTRERIRQIEWVALRKLRHNWDVLEGIAARKGRLAYFQKHDPLPIPPQKKRKPLRFSKPTPTTPEETKMKKRKHWRDKAGVPEGFMLIGEAATSLGWTPVQFRQRVGMEPAGHVMGPTGRSWSYWSKEQIEDLRGKWAVPATRKGRKPRRITEVTPAVDSSEAFPAMLVVRAKVSGISMTIPVFVQQIARAENGNHQVRVKFPGGSVTDSIFDNSIIVWAKDLLTMDYSPFKAPWD